LRLGHDWLIPLDAIKPASRRGKKTPPQYSLSLELAKIIEATTHPFPRDNPDAIMDMVKEERLRLYYEGELAYLRGDFERAKRCFGGISGDDAAKLRACSLFAVVVVGTGEYALFQEIESYCQGMIRANLGADVTAAAELALVTAYVGAFIPVLLPDWLKDGDFSALPRDLRPEALCRRVRYLHFMKKYESMLDVAQTALTLESPEDSISYPNAYLRLMCAAACCLINRRDDAEGYLLGAMRDYLPHGFITLFAELAPLFGGMLERLLEREYPEYYAAVTGQSERVIPKWLDFHNRLTKDNITLILSRRDYQIALLAARGVPNKKIAEHYNMSLGRTKNKISEIYAELHIDNRENLKKLIL